MQNIDFAQCATPTQIVELKERVEGILKNLRQHARNLEEDQKNTRDQIIALQAVVASLRAVLGETYDPATVPVDMSLLS